MQRIPTKVHGYVDYATGAFLLAAPRALGLRDRRSAAALRLAGGGALAYSLLTDYEAGVRRVIPMKAHLALDAGSGLALLTSPWRRGYAFRGPSEWLPLVLAGLSEIAAAALTQTTPGDGDATASVPPSTISAPSPSPSGSEERLPVPPVPATDPVDSAEEGIGMPAGTPAVAGGVAALASDDPISDVPIAERAFGGAADPVAVPGGVAAPGQDDAAADVAVPGGDALAEAADSGLTSDPRAELDAQGGEGLEAAADAGVTAPGADSLDDGGDDAPTPSAEAEAAEALDATTDTDVADAEIVATDPDAADDDADTDPLPGVVSADPEERLEAGAAGPADTAEEDLERAGASGRAPMGNTVVSAPPPIDMPGPSVTAPDFPESETERAERADFLAMDSELLAERVEDPVEAMIAEEEAAAALEAKGIGGPGDLDAGGDPAMEAVYQAGGGEAEGFELAEADLIENATHGEGHGDPLRDAITPEAESDRSSAEYGEADEEDVTEVVADPDADPDTDPGAGPGLATER